MQGVSSAYRGLNEAQQAHVKALQDEQRASLNLATAEKSQSLSTEKLKIQKQQLTKASKQAAKEELGLVSAYDKLVAKMNTVGKVVQNLNAKKLSGEELTKKEKEALRKATAEFNRYSKAVLGADASIKRFQRNVGNYPKQLTSAANAARNLASAMGLVGGAFLLVKTVRNAIGVFKDFNQSQADLSAILGRSTSQITELTEQAKELGATTAFTATQVAQLQLELAKLGFNDDQILAATLGIENLAIATGVEAARAAKLGGAALRGFALDASEANRVASVLAVSTTKSASTFESLEVAMPKVSAIAKSFGFTIEDTTALLGGLQNAGFEASIAGTSLRQIFLQLADSNGKLAKRLGGGAKDFNELISQFKKAEEQGISLSEAFNLTNARSVAAFKTFLSGADDLLVLRDSIVEVEDELDTLAKQKLDSVQGKVTLLNSAWEGWILSLDESGEAANSIKRALSFLTVNLSKILDTVVKLGKAFLTYKAIMIAASLATKAWSAITALSTIRIAFLKGGIKAARIEMQAFNIATKANPLGALLSVLAGGVAIWAAFRDGVRKTSQAFKDMKKNADLATDAIVKNTIAKIEEQIRAIDEEIDNEKKANKKKIDLLNENIKKQKEGVANLYDDVNNVVGEGEKKRQKTIKESNRVIQEENARAQSEYLKKLQDFQNGLLDEAPDFPEFKTFTKEQERELTKQGSIRTEAEIKLIKKLEDLRLKLVKSLNKKITDENKKLSEEDLKINQKLLEFELKELIKQQNRIIDNKENANYKIVEALRQRMLLQMNLEKSMSKFAINSSKLTGNALVLEQRKLQSKLTDIIINGQSAIKKARQRDESDTSLDENNDIGIDTKLFLINGLVEAGQGTFEELSKMYDDDLQAFLELAQKKLNITKRYTDEQRVAIEDSFNGLSDVYEIDASKFLRIFEEKKLTTQDYVDIAGEAMTGLYNSFQKNYDLDLEKLSKSYESAILFAGEGKAAREEIDRQYQERQDEIRNKQAKQEKEQALFSVLINTARGITAALTSTPPNVPLSIAIGSIGALQAVKIASTKIPQFKDGVRGFEGGLAIVGDGGKSEVIRTPDGGTFKTPSTDTIVNLPKGSDVFSSEDEFLKDLRRLTDMNNIMFDSNLFQLPDLVPSINIQNGGASAQDIDRVMGKYFSQIATNNISFDKNGIKTWVSKGNSATVLHNNRTSFKGFSV